MSLSDHNNSVAGGGGGGGDGGDGGDSHGRAGDDGNTNNMQSLHTPQQPHITAPETEADQHEHMDAKQPHEPSASEELSDQEADSQTKKGRRNAPANQGFLNATLSKVVWTPKRLRHDPERPFQFTYGLNTLYALATTFTVANLYYNQPILDQIAETFSVSHERASSVATLIQSGYAAGLLFVCPLGDVVPCRPFIISLVWITAMLWLGLCITDSFQVFQALSFIVGVTTVTPQLMLPLVGKIAPANRKGTALSIIVSGLMLGMLVGRLFSGIMSEYTDWRNIYWLSFGAQQLIVAGLFFFMPDYPSSNPDGINYLYVLWTILKMQISEPVLVQASTMAFLISFVFTSFWTTLTFLLTSPPYNYGPLVIGLFSLIGLGGIILGPIYGRFVVDRLVPLCSAILGLLTCWTGVIVGTYTGNVTMAGPAVQAFLSDCGIQMAHTANRKSIYTINPKALNRVNTAYMLMAFCGQLTGTAVGNRLYAEGGWVWSGSASVASVGLAVIVAFARGPNEKGWVGWSGGWEFKKKDPVPAQQQPAAEPEKSKEEAVDSEKQ